MAVATTETYAAYEREPGVKRICWGAIIAGAILALVTLFTLSVLGTAIGLTVLDPGQGDEQAKGLGIGATVWWVVCSVIAVFIGGWAAAKLSAVWTQTNGILHGIITWALTLVILAWLLTSTAGAIMGGALSTLQSGMEAGAQAADQGAFQQLQQKVQELTQQKQQEEQQETPQEQQQEEQKKEETAEKAVTAGAAAAWGSFVMLLLGAIAGAIGGCVGAKCNKKQIEDLSGRGTTVRT